MIPLRARSIKFNDAAIAAGSRIVRLSTNHERPRALSRDEAFVISDAENVPAGFSWYISYSGKGSDSHQSSMPLVELPAEFGYLGDGDVVALEPKSGTGARKTVVDTQQDTSGPKHTALLMQVTAAATVGVFKKVVPPTPRNNLEGTRAQPRHRRATKVTTPRTPMMMTMIHPMEVKKRSPWRSSIRRYRGQSA